MTDEEKAAKKVEYEAKWAEKKANATPEQLEKMEAKEAKRAEWSAMTDEEKLALKE